MPNNESAKKRVRQTVKRNALNQWRKRRIKEQVKTFLKAVQDQNVETAESEFRKTCSILDKVATSSTLHRNTVARPKSRRSRRLLDMKSKAAPA